MFYAFASSYLTEFVIGHGRTFSHCNLNVVSAGVVAAIGEDDEEYASSWKGSWVLCAGYGRDVRGRIVTIGEAIVKSAWKEEVAFSRNK